MRRWRFVHVDPRRAAQWTRSLVRDDLMETRVKQAGETTILISSQELAKSKGCTHVAMIEEGRCCSRSRWKCCPRVSAKPRDVYAKAPRAIAGGMVASGAGGKSPFVIPDTRSPRRRTGGQASRRRRQRIDAQPMPLRIDFSRRWPGARGGAHANANVWRIIQKDWASLDTVSRLARCRFSRVPRFLLCPKCGTIAAVTWLRQAALFAGLLPLSCSFVRTCPTFKIGWSGRYGAQCCGKFAGMLLMSITAIRCRWLAALAAGSSVALPMWRRSRIDVARTLASRACLCGVYAIL